MVCARFIGNHAAITIAGHFQLNVMLPLVAYDLQRILSPAELTKGGMQE
jgi:fumarate hydratase class II